MDAGKLLEERLREAACFGDEEAVQKLIERGVNVNSQHHINGWTALHWAAKRNHKSVVSYLLSHGADKSVESSRGETPAMLTDNEEIKMLLETGKATSNGEHARESPPLPICPNYLSHPPLNYRVDIREGNPHESMMNSQNAAVISDETTEQKFPTVVRQDYELVLKVRLANSQDPDFIEIEISHNQLTYNHLLEVCCDELNIDKSQVARIRKLPNTVLRKDKDIQRLQNFQELEVVLDTVSHLKPNCTSCSSINSTSPTQHKTFLKNSSAPPPPGYMTVSSTIPTATKNLFEKSTFCKNGTILY